MSDEFQNQKNTVATVGMRFSIIGLIALISIFFMRLGLPLLFVGFILGVIGLFYKPRVKARIAICIPLVVFIVITSIICYIWSSVKTPAKEWYDWVKPNMEQLFNEESFDNDKFSEILQGEFNKISSSLSEEEFKTEFENSTGSNTIEKLAYFGFGLFQQAIENSIEKYKLPEVYEEDVNDLEEENIEGEIVDTDKNDDNVEVNEESENSKEENVEVFDESEKNDIEQILNILE